MGNLAISIAIFVAGWVIYTGLLWAMIKIQKLNYNVLGLFGSSLAAALVERIPYFGGYISYVVLILCLWKCTQADIAPDLIFTVVIAGALMFCVNLFVLGALMGPLRPDLAAARPDDSSTVATEENAVALGADTAPGEEDDWDGEETAEGDSLAPAPAPAPALTPGQPAAPGTTPAPRPATNGATIARFRALGLKGISIIRNQPEAMFTEDGKIKIVHVGDTLTLSAPDGPMKARVEEIARSYVVLSTERGERVKIFLR